MKNASSRTLWLPLLALAVGLCAAPAASHAQDGDLPIGFTWAVVGDELELTFTAVDVATEIEVEIRCDSPRVRDTFERERMDAGDDWSVRVEAPTETASYSVNIALGYMGVALEQEFWFDVEMVGTLDFAVDGSGFDAFALEQSVTVTANQAVRSVEVLVRGDDGSVLMEDTIQSSAGPMQPFVLTWTRAEGTVLAIEMRVNSVTGLWRQDTLVPWSVATEIDNILFESGSADIDPADVERLQSYAVQFAEQAAGVAEWVDVRMYVAGFTDTVGSSSDNRTLSRDRAEALGEFMRDHGFGFPIHFQGFGEDVLAVPTPDETDEPSNRRAIFVLSVNPPGPDPTFPDDDWRELR